MYESRADRKAKHERYAFELYKIGIHNPKISELYYLENNAYANLMVETSFKLATLFIETYEELYETRAQEAPILHE